MPVASEPWQWPRITMFLKNILMQKAGCGTRRPRALGPCCLPSTPPAAAMSRAGSAHLHSHLLRLSGVLWPVTATTREFQLPACQWWWKAWGYQEVDTLNTLYRVSRMVCCQCSRHTSWAWHSGKFTGFGIGQTWVQIPTREFFKNSTDLLQIYGIPGTKLTLYMYK